MNQQNTDMQATMSRLKRIEVLNRVLIAGVIVALAAAGTGIVLGQYPGKRDKVSAKRVEAEVVDVEKIVLHDIDLIGRVLLTATDDGAGMAIYDSEHRLRATFAVTPTGPVLTMRDEGGAMRMKLFAGEDQSTITLHDPDGRSRAVLAVVENGPSLILADSGGHTRVRLDTLYDVPTLRMTDDNGEVLYLKP